MTSARRMLAVSLAWLAAATAGLAAPGLVRAAEYTMDTVARYEAMPEEGRVSVAVDVSFTNTTPDPPGQFSVFEVVKLAVHDQAAAITAEDDSGALEVAVGIEAGVNVATVTLRDALRYGEAANFRIGYDLPDGDGPQLRVRPSVIVFPAWGFGTASEVTVVLPDGYEVSIDGDPLSPQSGEAGSVLSSGPIADPSRWLAMVIGARQAGYTTLSTSVALEGGTVDLQVRAFTDDAAWGRRMLELLERALPLLEERIGVAYARLAPLVVTEAVALDATGFGEGSGPDTGDIQVAFDQPPFTALHQVAHVWLGPELIADRWIGEGLASWMSAQVAPELGVELPFDPLTVMAESQAAAFVLAEWPPSASAEQQRYGYAASWALIAEIADAGGADAGGADAIARVLERAAAGVDQVAPSAEAAPATPGPLTTRSFLDHLETVTGLDLAARFGELALTPADARLLPARAEAHAAYRSLLALAEDWGAPDPVRAALGAWDFSTGVERTDTARLWLDERQRLISALTDAGLAAPQRLRDAYREHGGAPEAWAELEAERAVAEAYAATVGRAEEQRSLIEEIGLVGGPDPLARLALASGRFRDGDLRGATDAISEAQGLLDGAGTSGMTRLLGVLVVAVLLAGLTMVVRRRRPMAESGR